MREILFRGKRLDNGEWVEGSLIHCDLLNGNSFTCILERDESKVSPMDFPYMCSELGCIDGYAKPIDPKTIGQYTGLRDKNGKQIFEGDICRNTRTGEVVFVAWHGTMAGYVWNKRQENGYFHDFGELFRAYDKFEVIGNIHDNPELLKGAE